MKRLAVVTLLLGVAVPARASPLDEAMQDLQKKLLGVDRPGQPLPVNEPRNVDQRELLPEQDERPFRVFRDLQVRRSGSAAHIVGGGLPVDVVTGVLPGTLLAMRLGAEARGFGLYGIGGSGTFTVYQHLLPQRDAEPISVTTSSVPFAFLGLGAELILYREVTLACEINWGKLVASRPHDRVLRPAVDETVQSAALALRVAY